MIRIVDNKMGLNEDSLVAIAEWRVMWRSPFGLHESRSEAVTSVIQRDLDPEVLIQPVAVAIDGNGKYEVR